ncbi:MAG: YfhO family protein [Blautia sp.]|nr:YfhO family protein [Blautia sp.]
MVKLRMVESNLKRKKAFNFYSLLQYLFVFGVTLLTGIIMYRTKEVAPFGGNSVLNMDLWGQYFPMYVQQSEIQSFSEHFFSFKGVLGFNNWAQSAYYTNAPSLLILSLFPVSCMIIALNWICILKIPLSAIACLSYLRRHTASGSPVLMGGAVAYSLCGYALAYMTQPMWTDALVLLPLVLIGLDALIYEEKHWFYFFMLVLCIFSNFYIGFSICIFCFLYFLFSSFDLIEMKIIEKNEYRQKKFRGREKYGASWIRFIVYSALAGGSTAVVTIPVWIAINQTNGVTNAQPLRAYLYSSFSYWLSMLMPGKKLFLGYNGANIFSGLFVLILIPLYFFNKSIPIKKKAMNAVFLILLMLSTNFSLFDYIWHGFHFPNQLPGRWVFLFTLLLVTLGAEDLSRWEGIPVWGGIICLTCGTAVFMFVSLKPAADGPDRTDIILFILGVVMLGAAVICGNMHKNGYVISSRKPALLFLAVFTILEVVGSGRNFVRVANLEEGGFAVSNIEIYTNNMMKQQQYGSLWKSGEKDFYRMAAIDGFTFNPAMIGNFYGIDYYSSTMNGSAYLLLKYLGNAVYAENVSTLYNETSPVQNSLFGIRYYLDYAHNLNDSLPGLKSIAEENNVVTVWENDTALPLGFAAADDITFFKVTNEIHCIDDQNTFLDAVCGYKTNVFTLIDPDSMETENCTLTDSSDWSSYFYSREDEGKPVRLYYSYLIMQDGPVYLESNFREGIILVTDERGTRSYDCKPTRQAYLGQYKKGETISITFESEDIFLGLCGLNLFRYDENRWMGIYNELSENGFDIKSFDNTKISGTINLENEGNVLFSIVQDGGWKVLCDGKALDSFKAGDALLCARVPSGTHDLILRYSPPGFTMGMVVTILSLICTFLVSLLNGRTHVLKALD